MKSARASPTIKQSSAGDNCAAAVGRALLGSGRATSGRGGAAGGPLTALRLRRWARIVVLLRGADVARCRGLSAAVLSGSITVGQENGDIAGRKDGEQKCERPRR